MREAGCSAIAVRSLRAARTGAAGLCLVAAMSVLAAPATLRIGLPLLPETLDPARADNAIEFAVLAGVHETLYLLDPLARPAALVPGLAAALPEASTDYRTWTVRVRPGVRFAPHPAFRGAERELVAADVGYALRRVLDPANRSPALYLLDQRIEGLDELAARARAAGRALDYDAPIPGLVVVDRHTLRIRLRAPDPNFPFLLAHPISAVVAREVVEAEGEGYGQYPVGTGAFRVESFVPGQRLTLVRSPTFRPWRWDDLLTERSRASAARRALSGRSLPGLDRIEFAIVPESASELMALRRGELDLIHVFAPELVLRNGVLKAELAREGLRLVREAMPITLLLYFSMKDPDLGGVTRERIALRRAIQMAVDDDERIRLFSGGQATMRHQLVPPGVEGFVPGYRNPNLFDPVAANALLDRFGYRRGPDGYRRHPDGSTLTARSLGGTGPDARVGAEFTKRTLDRIGVRVAHEGVAGGERLKRMSNCSYGMSLMDMGLDIPDGSNMMVAMHSRSIGNLNLSCFADAEFDAAYDRAVVMTGGPERTALFRTMQSRLDALGIVRPLPVGDLLLLARKHVVGPYPTLNDSMQLTTLGVDVGAPPPARR